MTPTTIVRRAAATTLLGLLLTSAASAAAVPDPGPSRQTGYPSYHHTDCGLERIEAQLVRCDSLTGAGVPAPAWIPERGTR